MYIRVNRPRVPRGGDIVVRPKQNGDGWHYGRLVESVNVLPAGQMAARDYPQFVVPHTTPEYGKHLGVLEEFGSGLPVGWIPQEFTEEQRLAKQHESVSDIGEPYTALATCEDDVLGFSPTRDQIVKNLFVIGAAALIIGLVAENNKATTQ
jgi:hypothetical protein